MSPGRFPVSNLSFYGISWRPATETRWIVQVGPSTPLLVGGIIAGNCGKCIEFLRDYLRKLRQTVLPLAPMRSSAAFKSNLVTETFIVYYWLLFIELLFKKITVKETRDGGTFFWFVSVRKRFCWLQRYFFIQEVFSSFSFVNSSKNFYGRSFFR